MKIAVIIRGQPRQYSAGSKLLKHFLTERFPEVEFSTHVYSWTSSTPSTAGILGDRMPYFHAKETLYKQLKDAFNPSTLHVEPDNTHYKDLIYPLAERLPKSFLSDEPIQRAGLLYWKTSQILAHYRGQSQLAEHCMTSGYKPDYIVDTRSDMSLYGILSSLYKFKEHLNTNPDDVIAPILYSWSNTLAVGDNYYIYSLPTLLKLTQRDSINRYNSSYKHDIKHHKELQKHNIYNSHTLYPLMCFKDMNIITPESIDAQLPYSRLHSAKLENCLIDKDTSIESYYSIMDKIPHNDTRTRNVTSDVYLRLYNKLYSNKNPDNS